MARASPKRLPRCRRSRRSSGTGPCPASWRGISGLDRAWPKPRRGGPSCASYWSRDSCSRALPARRPRWSRCTAGRWPSGAALRPRRHPLSPSIVAGGPLLERAVVAVRRPAVVAQGGARRAEGVGRERGASRRERDYADYAREATEMSRAIELPPIEDEEAARPRWSERLAALAGMGTGWRTIAAKELSDNILNVRFYVLLAIVGLAAIGTVYFSSQGLKDAAQSVGEQARQYTGHAPLFLLLFTVTGNPLPFPFFSLISFVLPLIGIAFGFDAINGERAEGTLPRLLAQPIHRDDVVNGKFAAGLAVIALILASVTAFV